MALAHAVDHADARQCVLQFYLGTTRLQLEQKGDIHLRVTGIANIVPAFGFLGIPVIGWLLDTKGYGITLGTINFLAVVASLFEAMPSLWFQVCSMRSADGPHGRACLLRMLITAVWSQSRTYKA